MQTWGGASRPEKKSKFEDDEDSEGSDGDEGSEASSVGPGGKKPPKPKSKGGSSCHQCKSRRNFTALTYCTSNLDKKNKKCRKKFCGHCLKKFYKENAGAILDKTKWKCPSCRKICCCAACRRRKQKESEQGSSPDKPRAPKKSKKSHPPNAPAAYPSIPTSTMPQPKYSSKGLSTPQFPSSSPGEVFDNPHRKLVPGMETPFSTFEVPPTPTLVMPVGLLSSPISTPLQVPGLADHFPEYFTLGGDYEERPPISQQEYSNLLEQQLSFQSSQETPNNPQFAKLYKIAQMPLMKKKIQLILSKKDIPKTQKVDCIAQLLRHTQQVQDKLTG